MRFTHRVFGIVAALFTLTGCSSVNFEKLSTTGPDFKFTEYFNGHTRASGWFADRFGNVKRHFCGDFYGETVDGIFKLDEKLYYSDGVIEDRIWAVTIDPDGNFIAESEALVGPATGIQQGSALHLKYVMNVLIAEDKTWKLSMNDFMFYQPDGSLHNSTEVSKWGVRIGNVSTQYIKHDGTKTCLVLEEASLVPTRRLAAAN